LANPEDEARGRVRLQAADTESNILGRVRAAKKVIDSDTDDYELLADYFEGRHTDPYVPLTATEETIELRKRSVYNLMPLAVSIPAQISFVDGYRRGGELFPPEWKNVWDRCNMPAKQTQIYKAALKYGQAWVGLENLGKKKPEIKLYSTRDTVGMFHDPVNDAHPVYLVTIKSRPLDKKNPGRAIYMDDERIVHFDYTTDHEFRERPGENYEHDLGVCPAVRYVCELDDVGNVRGVIEPLIPTQDAINQSKFNLLITQQFSSFKVRWAAGMVGEPRLDSDGDIMRDDNGQVMYQPVAVSPSRFLMVDDPQGKFGALDETPLQGFIESLEMEIKHFATQGQLPPHSLLGNMSNLSADTLIAAMGQTMRFGHVLKVSWGQSHEALLRLVVLDLGIDGGDDYAGEVRWRDMSDQGFATLMDGLGKAVQMVGVPRRFAWTRFPGVTTGDLEEMDKLAKEERQQMEDDQLNSMTDPLAAAKREYRPAKRPERGGIGTRDEYTSGTL
jgi:hypothetical protein